MHLYLALLLHRDYFAPAECISILLFCSTGIISTGQMHLYLPLLLHRDYFRRPDSSLSRSFAPQGLFPPTGFISISRFCSTGIISTGRIHLYLALLLHRDYFAPAGCISILLFCSTGINLPQPDASLSCSFVPQGLFRSAKCISILLFCYTGIIYAGRIHPQLALLLHRDYFRRPDASLSSSFAPQGLFPPAKCISILLFCYTGIISPRSDASLSSSFAPQGLFPPVECISILLFCYTGIISAGRIHLYLALLFHRDYFHRPNASLSCSFVSQRLLPPVECISNLGSCKVSATKLLLYRKHSYGFC